MFGLTRKKIGGVQNSTREELAKCVFASRRALAMCVSDKKRTHPMVFPRVVKVLRGFGNRLGRIEVNSFKNKRKEEVSMPANTATNNKKDTRRSINFELRAPNAKKVVLTGNFNSWNESNLSMKRDRDGIWKLGLRLNPGRYEYKFIVDGQWWADPSSSRTLVNSFGSANSVKEVA